MTKFIIQAIISFNVKLVPLAEHACFCIFVFLFLLNFQMIAVMSVETEVIMLEIAGVMAKPANGK